MLHTLATRVALVFVGCNDTNGDGKLTAADAGFASFKVEVTNATGTNTANSYDDNGDGVVDRLQTIVTVTNGDGSKTETRTNLSGSDVATAVVINSQVTTTSADGKIITINRDATGGGWVSQKEVQTTNADGSRSYVITDYAKDGVTITDKVTKTISADGKTRTESLDADGNGTTDTTTVHVISVVGGVRTETITEKNGDNSIRDSVSETISTLARGKFRTTPRAISIDFKMAA
jgi:hypothetical protein